MEAILDLASSELINLYKKVVSDPTSLSKLSSNDLESLADLVNKMATAIVEVLTEDDINLLKEVVDKL